MAATRSTQGAAREIELKLAVKDGDALEAIERLAGGQREGPVLQDNTFFDTKALALDAARYTVRVRFEGLAAFLTFKGPALEKTGALSSRVEEEWVITPGEAERMLAGQLDPLSWLEERLDLNAAQRALAVRLRELTKGEPLQPVATFQNERTRVFTELEVGGARKPVTLELDRTHFPDGTLAAEVELELDPGSDAKAYERALRDLLEKAGASPAPTSSKAARVFAWVRAQTA